jgi:hypothetical protein
MLLQQITKFKPYFGMENPSAPTDNEEIPTLTPYKKNQR